MTRRYGAVPCFGGGGVPLAGSAFVRFQAVMSFQGADAVPLHEVPEAVLTRLSQLRPPLCGLALDRPRIMGILNVTPDSFSDGGDLATVQAAVARAQAMAADILDIGGESTRPGAQAVGVADEIARVAPVIRALRDAGITTPISIDTRKAAVAEAALDAGADIVNDVSAFRYDPELADLVAERGVPVCLMHSKGDPATMQDAPRYDDVVAEVLDHLAERMAFAAARGIARDRMIVDPGIGFAKTQAHNLALLAHLPWLHDLGVAVLLGASRKKFIGTIGGAEMAKDRMSGSVAVALHGAAMGVQILRVHDVAETAQALALWQAINAPVCAG
ncbi:dihydropteroate synthase [Pseudorhodobacter wandonensis]|uniref:dihydropteroate synthase n=1 Tax=Pseudorhodobacter wandonensis TaxID=1120568 RepID=UPI00067B0C9E|nr:dihydropteroate synthase [Pseudorhodobacter wandonensis]